MILLVKFYVYLGRMGTLDGVMLVQKDFWEKIQGRRWYASDVLGKHSEVYGEIGEAEDWSTRELTDEQVELLRDIFDFNLEKLNEDSEAVNYFSQPVVSLSGFCPIQYMREED